MVSDRECAANVQVESPCYPLYPPLPPLPAVTYRNAMNAPEKRTKAQFNWQDPLLLDQQLTQDERMVREAARAYCQGKLAPRVLDAFRHEKTDPAIFREMGELG